VKTLGGHEVGDSQNDSYSDDPVEEIVRKKLPSKFLATGALLLGSLLVFQGTFAGNISLNSGAGVEFGQGVTQAVACSGETSLTLVPRSSFTNGSPGAHYLNSVTVSNIPDNCFGVDFTINAYDDTSSTPLALFNDSSTSAVVYDQAGTFSRGTGSTGMTVASSTGTFTATFTVPVAQSSNVFKLTIQSGAHTPYDNTPSYVAGNAGPGGGSIYYVDSAGFSCGATYISTGSPTGGLCHYLEVAPYGWNTGDDPVKRWSTTNYDLLIPRQDSTAYNNALGIGRGYQNSIAIVTSNGDYNPSTKDYAAGAARAYTGGSKSDWYLPSTAELNLLCQWNHGVESSVITTCTAGTLNSATRGAQSAGIADLNYWSSSERTWTYAWRQNLSSGGQIATTKVTPQAVRPIRAF